MQWFPNRTNRLTKFCQNQKRWGFFCVDLTWNDPIIFLLYSCSGQRDYPTRHVDINPSWHMTNTLLPKPQCEYTIYKPDRPHPSRFNQHVPQHCIEVSNLTAPTACWCAHTLSPCPIYTEPRNYIMLLFMLPISVLGGNGKSLATWFDPNQGTLPNVHLLGLGGLFLFFHLLHYSHNLAPIIPEILYSVLRTNTCRQKHFR